MLQCCEREGGVTVQWSSHSEFSELIISEDMVTDHMPDVLLKALNSLKEAT